MWLPPNKHRSLRRIITCFLEALNRCQFCNASGSWNVVEGLVTDQRTPVIRFLQPQSKVRGSLRQGMWEQRNSKSSSTQQPSSNFPGTNKLHVHSPTFYNYYQ